VPARLGPDAHLAHLEAQGALVADAAGRGDPDAPVEACPGWTLREAVHHLGRVHRRVAIVITQRRSDHRSIAAEELGPMPGDAELGEWYLEGLGRVHGAIAALGPEDHDVATFGPAPSPRAFWARRQACEAGIHRLDVETAAGGDIAAFDPDFAADGVDELLDVFLDWFKDLRADPARSLHLHATDADGEWLLEIGPETVTAQRGHARAHCAVRATASDLFAVVWNRRARGDPEVFGDRAVLDLWRRGARI
jgi:uncharacterized protein (TIGR03083 family)